ncbi:metallophosphoesterase [Carboxylicivirga sp. M1479]|uniref:metallophosphoesterase n=1 Tax=Carboxylicivirga sp. M1479 TaxID=2594476 RepID=UPI00117796C1|nr:metallophosphoesterase [Carboxylicivirga sp. M1479]TRX70573.1 metallophosphoesterase [Carboxylicivirga sp. M1479]
MIASTDSSKNCHYDIIGDVHGHHLELQKLLLKMSYTMINGVWTHATRKAIFVGDFINRGPNSKGVIKLIREMVSAGTAMAILGNHEMNAILYFSKDKDGQALRVPGSNNLRLMTKLMHEYNGQQETLLDDIKWLRSLPLHLELDGIRVVHAYWNRHHLIKLQSLYKKGRLRKSRLKTLLEEDNDLQIAFWETLKGIELQMPNDLVIKDSDQVKRDNFRVKWWVKPHGQTFRNLSYGNKFELPDYTIPNEIISDYKVYEHTEPIVFIGHYCMGKGPMLASNNIGCVDACITTAGRLAAYRYEGEEVLTAANFIFVSKL